MRSKYLAIGILLLLLPLLNGCEPEPGCGSWIVQVVWTDPTTGQSDNWTGSCEESLSLEVSEWDDICVGALCTCAGSLSSWDITGPQGYQASGSNFPFCFQPGHDGDYVVTLWAICVVGQQHETFMCHCAFNLSVNITCPSVKEFILVGTAAYTPTVGPLVPGEVLLYKFNSSIPPMFAGSPTVVADFTGGVVQGLDIFDYEGDGDLDFIALVRFQSGSFWDFELFLFNNSIDDNGCLQFTKIPITSTLPHSSYPLGGCTAADFDYTPDGKVDFIVAIGFSASPTKIFRFKNTGVISAPFTQLPGYITEDWANHAHKMDSADFNNDGLGDFTTFDYTIPMDFRDDVVIYQHGNAPFGNVGDFPGSYEVTPHEGTLHSVAGITAGQFSDDGWPDVIVGGDDDGDPGQYWLYANTGSNFSGTCVEVFDLNPEDEPPDCKSDPGGGNADAYDFNADGMMDVVAYANRMAGNETAESPDNTTIWYVQRIGSQSFAAQWPGGGSPIAPSSVIDIFSINDHGRAASIAAPMATSFGVGGAH